MQAGLYVESDEDGRALTEAHDRVVGDPGIQFELPDVDGLRPVFSPDSSGAQGTRPDLQPYPPSADPGLGPVTAPPTAAPTPAPVPVETAPDAAPASVPPSPPAFNEGLNEAMKILLWVAAAVALAILLYWLYTLLRDRKLRVPRKSKQAKSGVAEVWRPAEAPARVLLDEAEVLANEGRYDEAARLLLHRSIREIDAHRPDLVRPALTSRDIAVHPALPAGPASAFARIAALVERSFFARRPLGAEDWQLCRAAYRDFAFAEAWQG